MKSKLIKISPLLIFILISLFTTNLYSRQKQADWWYFGDNAGLHFVDDKSDPIAVTDGLLSTMEGSSNISDINGNLLFYTDGINIWNKKHELMRNGTNLKGDPSSSQSGLIVQKPGSTSIYYVFSIRNREDNGLYYSIVDINLENGLGSVTSKNIMVYQNTYEKLNAALHSNGKDIWIVLHENSSKNYRSYLLSSDGLSSNPVISTGIFTKIDEIGYLRISMDSKKIATAFSFDGIEIADFDNSNGKLSNFKTIINSTNRRFYGLEFSPNSKILYYTDNVSSGGLYQVEFNKNLQSTKIASITGTFSPSPNAFTNLGFGALQLAPNNKIYMAINNSKYIASIESPDSLGSKCGYVNNKINLKNGTCLMGLPNFASSFAMNPDFPKKTIKLLTGNYTIDIDTDSFCFPIYAKLMSENRKKDTMKVDFDFVSTIDPTFFTVQNAVDSVYFYEKNDIQNIKISKKDLTLISDSLVEISTFCGRPMLSPKNTSPILFDSMYSLNRSLLFEKEDGSITITGVCSKNLRLIRFVEATQLKVTNQSNSLSVSFKSSDEGAHTIEIISTLGTRLDERQFDVNQENNSWHETNFSNLNSGLYFVRLRSQWQDIVYKLIISN
jgi:hypothetical protein